MCLRLAGEVQCIAMEPFPRCVPHRGFSSLATHHGLSAAFGVSASPGKCNSSRDATRFLEVSECMAMMGIKDYDFAGLNPTQSADLVGKAMCATALVKVLVPVLELLEVLRST